MWLLVVISQLLTKHSVSSFFSSSSHSWHSSHSLGPVAHVPRCPTCPSKHLPAHVEQMSLETQNYLLLSLFAQPKFLFLKRKRRKTCLICGHRRRLPFPVKEACPGCLFTQLLTILCVRNTNHWNKWKHSLLKCNSMILLSPMDQSITSLKAEELSCFHYNILPG